MQTTNELPDDPLKMPPPYWRSSGAIFQALDALNDLVNYLEDFLVIHPKVEAEIDEYIMNNPEEKEDDEEFVNIGEPLWELEHKIKLKCELSVFMSAIQIEDNLNRVIVFNLNKDIAEVIEKLSPPEKLQLVAASLTKESVKGKKPFEGVKRLTSWRNAYAHGHCTDRPTKSLRHNHLISPENYPSVPKEVEFLLGRMEDYLLISKYLASISINNYTKGGSVEDDEINSLLKEIKKYKFTYDGNGDIYVIERHNE